MNKIKKINKGDYNICIIKQYDTIDDRLSYIEIQATETIDKKKDMRIFGLKVELFRMNSNGKWTINWGGLGSVELEYAEKFIEVLKVGTKLAKKLNNK